MRLIKSYQQFLTDPTSVMDFIRVAGSCDCRGDSAELFRLYSEHSLEHTSFPAKSNGSSGISPALYSIGPIESHHIWTNFQRGRSRTIFLKHGMFFMTDNSFKMRRIFDWDSIHADVTRTKGVLFIIDCLEELKPQYQFADTCIEAAPIVFALINSLNNRDLFYNYIQDNQLKLISTSSDQFFKKHYPVFDRMIDWKTGFNFHECDFHGMHVIPCWHVENDQCNNLLNLSHKEPSEVSDVLEIEPDGLCHCGLMKYQMYFISHFKNCIQKDDTLYHDTSLIERLSDKIIHIQFLQKGHELQVCYLGDLTDNDKIVIQTFFTGFEVTYLPNAQVQIGTNKFPTFWKDTRGSFNVCNTIF